MIVTNVHCTVINQNIVIRMFLSRDGETKKFENLPGLVICKTTGIVFGVSA